MNDGYMHKILIVDLTRGVSSIRGTDPQEGSSRKYLGGTGFAAKTEDFMSICDSLKICKFVLFGGVSLTDLCQWLNAVTGWDVSVEELIKTGERITNLKRLHNIRFGLKKQDDGLPRRLRAEKRGTGGTADNLPDINAMLKEYYEYRGWSDSGMPLSEKIKELDLETI